MRRPLALILLTAALASGCSRTPETLPNPYVRLASAPIRTIGLPEGSSPFAEALANALAARGYALRAVPRETAAAALPNPYADRAAFETLAGSGVDGVLIVAASHGGGGMGGEGGGALERPSAATASLVATRDGAVVASADWRPRLGTYVGPTPTRRAASGPFLGSDLLAPVTEQLADALAAQIER